MLLQLKWNNERKPTMDVRRELDEDSVLGKLGSSGDATKVLRLNGALSHRHVHLVYDNLGEACRFGDERIVQALYRMYEK